MKYTVHLSPEAEADFDSYIDYISDELDAPLTALKHYEGLSGKINELERNPKAYPMRNQKSLIKYGLFVRRVNYKRMAVLYTIFGDVVFIHRIIASSMITGL